MDDELFLETNQTKILERLTAHEFEKRFGKPEDAAFKVCSAGFVERQSRPGPIFCDCFKPQAALMCVR